MKKITSCSRFVLPTLLVLGFLFTNASQIFAATSGPAIPGTISDSNAVGNKTWSNPSSAKNSNNNYATVTLTSSSDQTHYLKTSNAGFSIPAGSTINGIQVSIEKKQACAEGGCSSAVTDTVVKLVKGGTVVGNNKASATSWPTSDTVANYGSTSDLWGTTWSVAEINDSGFGVVLSAERSSGGDRILSVDNMTITVTYTAAIIKTNPTLSISNSPVTFNGSNQSATISGSVAGVVSDIKYDGSSVIPTNAGTYSVTADFIPTDTVNYNNLSDASAGNFVINKASSNTAITCSDVTYNGEAQTPCTVSVTGAGGLSLTPTPTYTTNTNAGTAGANYTFNGDMNHNGSSDSKSFSIAKADANITVTGFTGNYDGVAHGASGSAVGVGEDGILSGLNFGSSFTNFPGGTANWTFTDSTGNYNDNSGSVEIVINKKPINIQAQEGEVDKSYDGNTSATVILYSEDLIEGDNITFSYNAEFDTPEIGIDKDVSVTNIAISGGEDSENYTLSNTTTATHASINQHTASIVLSGDSPVTYNGSQHSFTATTDPEDLSYAIFYNNSITAPTSAGHYTVFATITDEDYAGTDTSTLEINKADQTIENFDSEENALAPKKFGDEDFELNATATSGLIVTYTVGEDDNCTVSGNTIHITGAGICNVTAHQDGDSNYNSAEDVSQSFEIAKANQAITFDAPDAKTMGDPDFYLNASSDSELDITYSTGEGSSCEITGEDHNMVHILAIGTCTITASQAGNENYEPASPVTRSFTIAQLTHKITVSSGINGVIAPAGDEGGVTVADGENQTFTITPDSGFHILNVMIDGEVSLGAVDTYTFTEVTTDHSISASFEANQGNTSGSIPSASRVLGASIEKGEVLGAEKFIFTEYMKLGSKNGEVDELQKFLNDAGYDCGAVDGIFGTKTDACVRAYQKANPPLKVDGIVGPLTRAVLNK